MINPFVNDGIELSPQEFELAVLNWLKNSGEKLKGFEIKHDVKEKTYDGTYQIDVLATFEALGLEFQVIIECKKHNRKISREVIQILNDRIRSIGAQKGVVVTTSGFQSGAIQYAEKHGISLVTIANGDALYQTRSLHAVEKPKGVNFPQFMGWHIQGTEKGCILHAINFEKEDFYNFINNLQY